MEELLKIAKEKYPVGTRFKSVRYGTESIVRDLNFTVDNGNNIYTNDSSLYYENQWAENISKPEVKEKDFFETATESLCKMLQAKNKAYGESALNPLDIFAKHHLYGARIDEKLARVKNCKELRKNDVADIIGGLLLICKDKGWNDFTDLID